MKVFLSHPMHGLTDAEVKALREEGTKIAKLLYGDDVVIIDNYHHGDSPVTNARVWHLGKSIQQMSEADIVIFLDGWSCARGCLMEEKICINYEIPILYFAGS